MESIKDLNIRVQWDKAYMYDTQNIIFNNKYLLTPYGTMSTKDKAS